MPACLHPTKQQQHSIYASTTLDPQSVKQYCTIIQYRNKQDVSNTLDGEPRTPVSGHVFGHASNFKTMFNKDLYRVLRPSLISTSVPAYNKTVNLWLTCIIHVIGLLSVILLHHWQGGSAVIAVPQGA